MKILSILILTLLTAALVWISFCRPYLLSDQNDFLAGFVTHELLSVLGVIVTITLASAASLHLEFNRLEDEYGEAFQDARDATRNYAFMLIGLFAAALALVIFKPIMVEGRWIEALFNSGAIIIVVLNIMALFDITYAIFQIPAKERIKK